MCRTISESSKDCVSRHGVQGSAQLFYDVARSGRFTFDDKSVYAENKGSGNTGYLRLDQMCPETILEMIQRQVERCDHSDSFVGLLSLTNSSQLSLFHT